MVFMLLTSQAPPHVIKGSIKAKVVVCVQYTLSFGDHNLLIKNLW